jgi:hypothetical protein
MKNIILTSILLLLFQFNLKAQFQPSDCANLDPSGFSYNLLNNNQAQIINFNKSYLACDNVSLGAYNGFSFKAQYSMNNLTGYKGIFKLKIGINSLLYFRINNQKIEVARAVIHRPCNTWNNGACTSFGPIIKGSMNYDTWDDEFIDSTTGWIHIQVQDNMMKIKISSSENGPYKTEYNYEGLHLSGVDQALKDNTTTKYANFRIYTSSLTGLHLTNITFRAGHFSSNPAIVIDNNTVSPETNYPSSAARTSEDKVKIEEIIAEQDIISTLLLYPNPSKDGAFSLKFGLNKEGPVNFEIANLAGQVVYQKQNQLLGKGNHTLQFGKGNVALAAGFYIVRVFTNEYSKSLKLVVE